MTTNINKIMTNIVYTLAIIFSIVFVFCFNILEIINNSIITIVPPIVFVIISVMSLAPIANKN